MEITSERSHFNNQHITKRLSKSQIRNLAAVIAAQNVLKALNMNVYQSGNYAFIQQGDILTIEAKDDRGVIVQLEGGAIIGQVSKQDVLHFSALNQAVEDNLRSSNLLDLATSITDVVPDSQIIPHSATIGVSNADSRGLEF